MIKINYKAHYDRLIARGQRTLIHGYRERHHIIPKCLGGTNSEDNLVWLTAEEHYVAHQLLVKIYPDNKKLIYAAKMMTIGSSRRSNKLYSWLRQRFVGAITGRKNSDKQKEAARKSVTGNQYAKGLIRSPETRLKISIFNKNRTEEQNKSRSRKRTEEQKQHLRDVNTGRKHSEETKLKISLKGKGKNTNKKIVVTCPHCNKSGGHAAMIRWHFDNCKLKGDICLNI